MELLGKISFAIVLSASFLLPAAFLLKQQETIERIAGWLWVAVMPVCGWDLVLEFGSYTPFAWKVMGVLTLLPVIPGVVFFWRKKYGDLALAATTPALLWTTLLIAALD